MIELQGITKSYATGAHSLQVLKGVDMRVQEGELVAIMGSSGSGKSTLLNILGLLDAYDEGSYRLSGKDMSALSERRAAELRREMLGFVFQSFQLMGNLTALENVMLPLELAERRDARKAAKVAEARAQLLELPPPPVGTPILCPKLPDDLMGYDLLFGDKTNCRWLWGTVVDHTASFTKYIEVRCDVKMFGPESDSFTGVIERSEIRNIRETLSEVAVRVAL